MTNGLVKERKTLFINGYAVQWFSSILKDTKIFIYCCMDRNKYRHMADITLDYVADDFTIESIAKEKIMEIESL